MIHVTMHTLIQNAYNYQKQGCNMQHYKRSFRKLLGKVFSTFFMLTSLRRKAAYGSEIYKKALITTTKSGYK